MTEAELRAALHAAQAENAALRARLAAMEASTVWRLTAPAMTMLDRHPGARAGLWLLAGRTAPLRDHRAVRRLIRLLLQHGMWDPGCYAAQRPDLAGTDLLRHYATTGRFEGMKPSAAFDPAWYAVAAGVSRAEAPMHYLLHGRVQGRPTNRLDALRATQAAALGDALPAGRLAIGIVTYDTPAPMLQRVLRSVAVSARAAGVEPLLLLLDNGGPASEAVQDRPGLVVLPSGGNVGFGAGHNRLLRAAFDAGAACYLALNPDAALHPVALGAMLRMSQAAGGRALVEALQFPAEHTVPYDPATFDTPWVSGACLLIPRAVHDAIGGFDDGFFMYCEDVDLSWRARAAGLRTLTCAPALLFHPTTDRVLDPRTHEMFLCSGLRLAVKWGDAPFADRARAELRSRGMAVPDLSDVVVVEGAAAVADFRHDFTFAPGRW